MLYLAVSWVDTAPLRAVIWAAVAVLPADPDDSRPWICDCSEVTLASILLICCATMEAIWSLKALA